jgi:serine/threonine protein kinase
MRGGQPHAIKIDLLIQMLRPGVPAPADPAHDLKPSMYSGQQGGEGTVKVLDFGLGHAGRAAHDEGEDMTVGTLAYIAPEVLMAIPPAGQPICTPSGTAYELFAGRHPFETAGWAVYQQSLHRSGYWLS